MEEEKNQTDTQEERHGVTLGAICHEIFQWKRFLAILAISLVGALILTLFVHYFINPKKTQYEAQFNFHVVRTASSSDRYGSGQFFVEEETLNTVKNSDERFAGVDVENMLPNGKYPIKVSQETVKNEDELFETYYLISINERVFADKKVAKVFERELIESIKNKAVSDTKALSVKDEAGYNGYQARLKIYNQAQTYEEKLAILVSQRDYIIGLYDGWMASYGNLYYVESKNLPLLDMREIVDSVFSGVMYNELASELSVNAYLPGSEDSDTLRSRRNTYVEQQDLNRRKLEDLKTELSALLEQYKGFDGASSSLMPQFGEFHSRIAALTEENADLQKKIDTIDKLLGDETTKAEYVEREQKFGASLEKIYDALMAQSEEIAGVAEEIATRESYTTILEIEETGGVSEVLVAVIATILCFIIAAAVCYAIVVRRKNHTPQSEDKTE